MNEGIVDTLLIAIRFLHFTAVMLLFGASLFPVYTRVDQTLSRSAKAMMTWIALISWFAWLAAEAVSMSGEADAWSSHLMLAKVLEHTQFGHIWRWRVGLLTLLACLPLASHPPRRLFCLVSAVAVATLAGVGHGDMGNGNEAWLHLGNQAVHILSASVWLGGLAGLLYLVRERPGSAIVRQALQRFSIIGMGTVLLIVGTGLVNAWFLVGSVHALLHTAYGQVLMLKLCFFTAMVTLALFNRLIVMPKLVIASNPQGPFRLLSRSVAAEQGFAILTVAVVSLLGTMTPGFGMHGMPM